MTISDLCAERGLPLDPGTLEAWVAEERRCVTAHLAICLLPNPWVREVLCELGADHRLAAVSSSASARLDACFEATGLADLFPPELRFSAEDSLDVPTSKPDPAIYLHAAAQLGLDPDRCLAVEDSVPGARSAVAAGCPLIGNVVFVQPSERAARAGELANAGALAVIGSWSELGEIVRSGAAQPQLAVGA
jgi:beta-phosphoglucomutase-like phosphatase (HAD superfamily)